MNTPLQDEVLSEAKRLKERSRSTMGRIEHGATRFVVRSFRIAIAVALGFVAYRAGKRLVAFSHFKLADLTLADIGGVVWNAAVALGVPWLAFYIAFGPGGGAGTDADFLSRAQDKVRAREELAHQQREEEARVAKYYARGRLYGILRDPKLGQKSQAKAAALWLLIVICIYAFMGLVGLLLSWR